MKNRKEDCSKEQAVLELSDDTLEQVSGGVSTDLPDKDVNGHDDLEIGIREYDIPGNHDMRSYDIENGI